MKIAVVGGGIAGVMTALKLQSDGHVVTLIERHSQLAVEATSEQHGWGQFGQLYSHLEDEGVALACFKNIKTLIETFNLPGNNLMFSNEPHNKGELISNDPKNPDLWYRDDLLKYSYKGQSKEVFERVLERKWKMHTQGLSNDVDFSQPLVHKKQGGKIVELSVQDLVTAKKGFREFKRLFAKTYPNSVMAKNLIKEQELGIDDYTTITSHDRPMRSLNILKSAIDNFEKMGGIVQTNTEIVSYVSSERGVTLKDKNGQSQNFEKVVYTAGIGLELFNNDTFQVNTVISPLLVVRPAISDQNLVKVTPDSKETINHLCHIEPETGQSYSLIGNGDAVKPDDVGGIAKAKLNIVDVARKTFPQLNDEKYVKTVYFGYKTEFQKQNATRNYHYSATTLDNHSNVIAAVPGKFTLAPSLAVAVSEEMQKDNSASVEKPEETKKAKVSRNFHQQIVADDIEDLGFRENRNKVEKISVKKASFFNAIRDSKNIVPAVDEGLSSNNQIPRVEPGKCKV